MEDASKRFQLLLDGKTYQNEYLDLIKVAKESIVLHTYIFKLDDFGEKVLEALIKKADDGVRISLLVDFFGSFDIPKNEIKILKESGIDFHYFNPFRFYQTLQFGRRLHHKVLLVDQRELIIGGINVIDGYDDDFPEEPRLDFAIKIKDSTVKRVYEYLLSLTDNLMSRGFLDSQSIKTLEANYEVRFLINDWFNERKHITSSYEELIKGAKREVLLVHGYFFPSLKIIKLLKRKAVEGVKVRILLPRYSDWESWVWATSYLYKDLVDGGIKVYVWPKSNLHGKLAIFDNNILTLGSHNLNYTSSYGNLEMNVEIRHLDFVGEVLKYVEEICVERSIEIGNDSYFRNLLFYQRIRNALYYYLLSFIALISVNLIKFGRNLISIHPLLVICILFSFFLGIIGLLIPIIPGIPFLLLGILIYLANKKYF